jgi:hypothetical protein
MIMTMPPPQVNNNKNRRRKRIVDLAATHLETLRRLVLVGAKA